MRLSYDPKYNIAYIKLRDKVEQVETIHISEEMNVDISPDGKVCGIELLNANEQLNIAESGELYLTEDATGKSIRFPLRG